MTVAQGQQGRPPVGRLVEQMDRVGESMNGCEFSLCL